MNSHRLLNVCVFYELCLLSSVCFLCFLYSLCVVLFCSFSAILTNLILFIFHVPNTTVLLLNIFVICLYLCPTPFGGAMSLVERTHNGGTPSGSV